MMTSGFRRILLALTCVFGFGSMAHADPRIPEFGVGAGYYGWIGIGGHVNVENILAPGVGFRARGGLEGVEITGLLRLEILYGFSGFVTLGGGYNVPQRSTGCLGFARTRVPPRVLSRTVHLG